MVYIRVASPGSSREITLLIVLLYPAGIAYENLIDDSGNGETIGCDDIVGRNF